MVGFYRILCFVLSYKTIGCMGVWRSSITLCWGDYFDFDVWQPVVLFLNNNWCVTPSAQLYYCRY